MTSDQAVEFCCSSRFEVRDLDSVQRSSHEGPRSSRRLAAKKTAARIERPEVSSWWMSGYAQHVHFLPGRVARTGQMAAQQQHRAAMDTRTQQQAASQKMRVEALRARRLRRC